MEVTISRGSTASVRLTWSASEEPLLWTERVKARGAPPAVTVAESNVLVTLRWTSSWTFVCVVLLVLLPGVGSVVPSEATVALFARSAPLSAVDARVTWSVNTWSACAASPVVFVQVTSWPAAEQPAPLWKVRSAGSVSATWNPPALSDGPSLWTVSV